MSRLEIVHYEEIESVGDNPRRTVRGIAELADSIAELGLLENLVVGPRAGGGRYPLKAGERRLRAVTKLATEGRHDGMVPVLIIESDGDFEALAENEGRHSVLVWETGDRYVVLGDERGFTQEEIAKKVGVPRVRVSLYQRIARGLGAPARTVLSRMPTALTLKQLEAVAALVDKDGVPDDKSQLQRIDNLINRPGRRKRRRRRVLGELPMRERLFVRYETLRYQSKLPAEVRPQVDAVLRYMDGTDEKLDLSVWGIER